MQTNTQSSAEGYRLRRAGPEHAPLLWRLYACQREPELRAQGWNAAQCDVFIEQQWRARNASYAARYPHAVDEVVLLGELPIGRLLIADTAAALQLVDIALLPEQRKRGLGTRLLQDLQLACARRKQGIALHVERSSAARRLYARLGFATTGQDEFYERMEWRPR